MLKIENVDIFGWEAAIRGMRNPMNSWDKSESRWEFVEDPSIINPNDEIKWIIGENDLKLMKSLSKAGSDHAKFLRMINVSLDLTAPLYFWKQFDQYKVGVTTNSCSTMHKIHAKAFELDDFSHEHLIFVAVDTLEEVVKSLNSYRKMYLNWDNESELIRKEFDYDKKNVWWQMIQLLPSSYNQKRTVQLNYQVLKSMYFARKDHKLDEWHTLCDWMLTLPYFKEICVEN